ncbi:DUF3099 domain-containing protein [uncultured Nocardioides sp.]|uniref:DUF3099 domain-containing protein n=1 Tax=uncultured Nocardioides sp. TaxID=198441 RepID=UPI0026383A4D|nr:DUF3099 domain-containing protein [uncultured Nocardioides sp.]
MADQGGKQRDRQGGQPQAVRITTAADDPREDQKRRQKRYLWSMSLRTICFIGALVVGDNIFRWILVAGAVFLPYIAVVLANAAFQRDDDFTMAPVDPQVRQLGPGESAPRAS